MVILVLSYGKNLPFPEYDNILIFVICISGSELLVRVNATGGVVGTVYDAGSNILKGVYELGDDLIVVMEETTKRLKFTSNLYPEIETYSYRAGSAEVIPYLVNNMYNTYNTIQC